MTTAEQLTAAVAVHAEGPVWYPGWGGLRWVDMLAGDILHLTDSGAVERWSVGSVAAAFRPRRAGGVVIATEREFVLADEAGGPVRALGQVFSDAGIRFNEGGCDPAGNFLVGTMAYAETAGAGTVYRLDPDGGVEVVFSDVTISNGLGWTADGTTAYYNDTTTQRIDAFSWDVERGLHDRRPFVLIDADHGSPDGLTVDAEGGVWTALFGGSAVRHYDRSGVLDEVIDVPAPKVTACTLGGERLDRLFITTSRVNEDETRYPGAGAVFVADVATPGLSVLPTPADRHDSPTTEGNQVQLTKLGSTGLDVSRIALGCMSYGVPESGNHPWTLDEEASRPFIRAAVEAGINFFDTANVYSAGTSEEIVGRALADYAERDEIVLATKVNGRMHGGPNGQGLSRKAILSEIDHSLRRLGTDYVDLYQIHRWDSTVPIEETLEALHDVVRAGKARYIGASSMWAWQFSQALYTADRHGWTRFVSMQDHYNLLNREEEREMLPLCADQGIGVIPWSPLARGRLTRAWDESSAREQTDEFGRTLYPESDRAIVEAVAEVADERGVSRAQVALAWMLHKPTVTAPIVGATKLAHLTDAVAAVDLDLSDDEVARLEKPYSAHEVAGFG